MDCESEFLFDCISVVVVSVNSIYNREIFAEIIVLDQMRLLLFEPPNETRDCVPIWVFENKRLTTDSRNYFVEGAFLVCSVDTDGRKLKIVARQIKLHKIGR